jgi:hypothetical protein
MRIARERSPPKDESQSGEALHQWEILNNRTKETRDATTEDQSGVQNPITGARDDLIAIKQQFFSHIQGAVPMHKDYCRPRAKSAFLTGKQKKPGKIRTEYREKQTRITDYVKNKKSNGSK